MCGCGPCTTCGESTKLARLNGTEVTILSGTHSEDKARSNPSSDNDSKFGTYAVIASAVVLAAIVGFTRHKQ